MAWLIAPVKWMTQAVQKARVYRGSVVVTAWSSAERPRLSGLVVPLSTRATPG